MRNEQEYLEEDDDEDDYMAAMPDSKTTRSVSSGPRAGRQGATSNTKCFGCGQMGHFKSDCPRRGRHQPQRQSTIECRFCYKNHFMRDCPVVDAARRAVDVPTKIESESSKPRTSAPGDANTAFKKEATAVVYDAEDSPVQVCDPALPVSEASTPGSPRMALFFIFGAVQTLPTWILADSGSVRNLIAEAVFNKLPYQPLIREPGDCRVIGGNGEALELRGFAVLPVTLGANLLWHEFGVVPNLPLEVLVGADVLAPHQCSLLYLKSGTKQLLFEKEQCATCDRFKTNPEVGATAQLKFVDRQPKHRRNRLRLGANFVATLVVNGWAGSGPHYRKVDTCVEYSVCMHVLACVSVPM